MNWSIEHEDSSKENKADGLDTRITTILKFKGEEVMRKQGMMGRSSLHNLCSQYNVSLYDPKMGKVCIADLAPADRADAIKKMGDAQQDYFSQLVLDPESNASAKRKYKGGSQ